MSVRRCLSWLAAIAALGAAACPAACGPASNDRSTSPAASSVSIAAPTGLPGVAYPQASDLAEGRAPDLAYREYRLPGVWSVSDYDDRVAALAHSGGRLAGEQISLLSLSDGRRRCVLLRPVNAAGGYWISQCKVTARWIAWEELSPGDDLVSTVTWKLYAAPVRAQSLAIGRPRLIDCARTSQTSRPLFDITGDSLVWMVNGKRDPRWPGLVYRCDLRRPPIGHAVLRAPLAFQSLIAREGRAFVTEYVRAYGEGVRLRSVRLSDGRPASPLDLRNTQGLVQFPAARAGWLSWSLFRDEEQANETLLYVRAPTGEVHLVAERGGDRPVFAGHYLFYSDDARDASGVAASRICGLDLGSMSRFVLQQTESETQGACLTPLAAPAAERTLVTQFVRFDQAWSAIRVYRLD